MIVTSLVAALLAVSPASAAADVADLIECRSDLPSFQAFAEAAISGSPPDGWSRIEGPNSLLIEFRLARPITVFGHATSHLAFASSGLLALIEGVEPTAIATALGVSNSVSHPAKFLGERVISRKEEDKDLSSRFTTIVALNVSTLDTHPDVVLAGCSYRVDVEAL
jgi:hypothetical protein